MAIRAILVRNCDAEHKIEVKKQLKGLTFSKRIIYKSVAPEGQTLFFTVVHPQRTFLTGASPESARQISVPM